MTSSGKTSIVKAIQSRNDVFCYAVSFDMFEEAIPGSYAYDDVCYGEAITAMYHSARAFCDLGRNVLINGLIMNLGFDDHYKAVQELFRGYPLEIFEVFCPLDVCKKKNIERGDRRENQSERQSLIMVKNIEYGYSVDTSVLSTEECADLIINKSIRS